MEALTSANPQTGGYHDSGRVNPAVTAGKPVAVLHRGVPAKPKENKMHCHCEIIMPRTKDIGKAIADIMGPFDENKDDPEEISGNGFWDFYVIGGRFAGAKEVCGYDENKITEFYNALKDKKITVSGLQCGKQEISPARQVPIVDQLWNEFFPTENGEIIPCPVFAHSNNQYDSDDILSCDISLVEEINDKLTCERVIISGPSYDDSKIEPTYMISQYFWNGVTHIKTTWDGKVKTAIKMSSDHFKHYRDEYRKKITVKPNWLCITVDYHS